MRQGYAPNLLLDVPASAKVFDRETISIAQNYVSGLPEHERIAICPISGLSTKTEAQNVVGCLEKIPSKRILLVTSDYHTRRALTTFLHELPNREFSVAGAAPPKHFRASLWERRPLAQIKFSS